jgi:hypothetical protein
VGVYAGLRYGTVATFKAAMLSEIVLCWRNLVGVMICISRKSGGYILKIRSYNVKFVLDGTCYDLPYSTRLLLILGETT